ncbi:hypothetical protein FHW00_004698 [Ochrobactrum sp. P6BSIII]|uniref:sialate O-acetylesterase n=1 Tax=unclassified Ochrobactrum TaxID=239106 RepID=UPI0009930313|nr:hypothetical protein [Ochrobactrum sp. P6BSIII]
MAIRPDYTIGTLSLTSGSANFTTSGSALQTAAVQAGDEIITRSGDVLIIATITGQNSGTLYQNCPASAAGAGQPLRIRFQPDGSRYQGAVRDLIEKLASGNVDALAGIDGATKTLPYFTGAGTMDALSGDANSVPIFTDTGMDTLPLSQSALNVISRIEDRSIFILVTGQSNATLERSYSWAVPNNLLIWNYNKTQGNIGTAFVKPAGNIMSLALGIGKRLAEQNPEKQVYVVNIALSGNTIDGWLPGAPEGKDVYADIVLNIPPALAAAGRTSIDSYWWWQGESDRGLRPAYPAKFEQMITRMRTNSWFPQSVTTTVFGTVNGTISGDLTYGYMNMTLQGVVNADPQRRKYVYTATIPASYWMDTPTVHMNGAGYELAGALGVDAFNGKTNGIQQQFVFDMEAGQIYVDEVLFTPVLVGTTTAGTGTYTTQVGRCWKVGRRVDFQIELTWTAHTGTGRMQINGLPYPAYGTWATNVFFSNLTYAGQVGCRVQGSVTPAIQVVQAESGSAFVVVPMDTAASLTICGVYYTP